MTQKEFALVLGAVESDNNAEAWGDGGQAMGRWQVHPAWVMEYAFNYNIAPAVDDTWDVFIGLIVVEFFARRSSARTPVSIAMAFHVGHEVEIGAYGWDAEYAARFLKACELLGIAPG
jgi:hypothetical protein